MLSNDLNHDHGGLLVMLLLLVVMTINDNHEISP